MNSATSNTSTMSTTSTTSTGTIIGFLLGSVAIIAIIIAIIYFIRKRRSAGVNVTPTTNTPLNAGNMANTSVGNNGLGPKANNYR